MKELKVGNRPIAQVPFAGSPELMVIANGSDGLIVEGQGMRFRLLPQQARLLDEIFAPDSPVASVSMTVVLSPTKLEEAGKRFRASLE